MGRLGRAGTGTGNTTPAFRYEYAIRDHPSATLGDHLGNTRILFTDKNDNGVLNVTAGTDNEIIQENNYYPFGMNQEGAWMNDAAARDTNYQYNSKELNDDFGLNWSDYGARWYDAAIGRFTTKDRFSEKYTNLSPYQYAANNPVLNIDVNGDSIFIVINSTGNNPAGGTSIQQTSYYYGQDGNGNYGFIDKAGNLYAGNNQFIAQATSALNSIRQGGTAGRNLIDNLVNGLGRTEIAQRSRNSADMTAGAYVLWNPSGSNSAPDEIGSTTRPAYIGLAHELVHIQDVWNGTLNNGTWQNVQTASGTVKIPNAEIYATHIENQIRAENGIPLRVSYGVDQSGGVDETTRIIHAGTRNSVYYDRNGITNFVPFVPLLSSQLPFSY